MMLPESLPQGPTDQAVCQLAARWRIAPALAYKLASMQERIPGVRLQIISGFRTRDEQVALGRAGRPTADPDVSTHTSCPATGADLRFSDLSPGNVEKAMFGEAATASGLRWGGGSPVDPATGIPSDWNHVDLGPRTS